jgi:hypothetical protein
MDMFWTNEAIDMALSQLKACRFATGMTQKDCMREVLNAAWYIQQRTVKDENPPTDAVANDGTLIGDWVKGKNGDWVLSPILYD